MPLDSSILQPSATLLQSIANPPPLPTIADIQAKNLALQNARLQSQNLQQQIGTGAIEQQQNQLALQQQQATVDAYRKNGGDLPKTIQALQSQGLYTQAYALQKQQNDLQDSLDKQNKAADEHQNVLLAHKKDQQSFLSNMSQTVLDNPDDASRAIAYDNGRSNAVSLYPELNNLPPHYTPDLEPKLQAYANIGKSPADIAEQKLKKTKADMQTSAIQAFQKDPQAGAAVIDQVLPASVDATANASYKAAFNSAMGTGGPDAAQKIIEAAAAHAASTSKETNPNILKAHVAQAVATEAAVTPLKIQQAVQTEIRKAQLAPGEFSSVVDPAARAKATADFEASSKEYADKMGAAQQFQDFIRQAQSGNKAAPGLLGISELRLMVNRINRQELEAVTSGAGSAIDRLQGFIGKYKNGQPIPPDVMRDMSAIGNTIAQGATRNYQNKVQMNRQIYGSNAQPIQLPGASPEVTTQAQYNALPSGASYTQNGVPYRKR